MVGKKSKITIWVLIGVFLAAALLAQFLWVGRGGVGQTGSRDLLSELKSAAQTEDYVNFAAVLKEVYEKNFSSDQDFIDVESEFYMRVTTKYFDKGLMEDALRISTAIYDSAPSAWRFRYLRIRVLEKLGRDAFAQSNLDEAEQRAMTILQMMYRPEGANLMVDVYIARINDALNKKDEQSAKNYLQYVWDYEVSQDRRDRLIQMKSRFGL